MIMKREQDNPATKFYHLYLQLKKKKKEYALPIATPFFRGGLLDEQQHILFIVAASVINFVPLPFLIPFLFCGLIILRIFFRFRSSSFIFKQILRCLHKTLSNSFMIYCCEGHGEPYTRLPSGYSMV